MGVTRYSIHFIRAIEDALAFGDTSPVGSHHEWSGTSHKLLKAIIQAMEKGLRKDGFVMLPNIGRLEVYERPEFWHACNLCDPPLRLMPAKRFVRFQIGKDLRKEMRDE